MDKGVMLFMCGTCLAIGFAIGLALRDKPQVIVENHINEPLSEWDVMKLAIIKTESEFNTLAVGKTEDYGVMQITPVYVDEVNRILGEDRYTHEEAFNAVKSSEMFEVYQTVHNPSRDIDKAIVNHNPTASSVYAAKVRRNMEWVRNYESIRGAI